ncbi:MAG: ABC transporter permease [Bacteroidota bacterium]
MTRNYLKIAWRNLKKNKGLFAINVIGLSLGIASCLLIALFVLDELSYDRFNEKSDQIVRVTLNAKIGDEIINEAGIMPPVGKTLVAELPEVLDATRIVSINDRTKVVYQGHSIRKGKLAFADSSIFKMFSLPFLKGDSDTALNRPNTVVLTQEQATAYFGNDDPLDKTIDIQEIGLHGVDGYKDLSGLYTVTGIIEKIPENSHFHFDLIASMAGNPEADAQSWLSGSYHTYLLLAEASPIAGVQTKLPRITEKYLASQLEAGMGITYQQFLENGNKVGLFIQPLTQIHLYSNLKGELEAGGSITTVYIFAAIALFMLFIACINFMNLSTAGASKRAKEIGMRKVLGSEKGKLIFQFLTESFIATLFAVAFGVLLFYLALPYFNQLADKSFVFAQVMTPQFVMALVGLVVIVGIMAGGYPAFHMSGFKPLNALRNRFTSDGSKSIRSGLVVFQFAISACLIIATLVVTQQMHYIQNKDVGYDREGLIVIREAGLLGNHIQAFKEKLKKDPKILNISTSGYLPAGPTFNSMTMISSKKEGGQKLRIRSYGIDEAYIPTMGMELTKGRNFSREFGNEVDNIIINEAAIKTFGLKGNPIGQSLMETTNHQGRTKKLWVIGVIKDFHARSLHERIEPLMMRYNPLGGLIVRAKVSDMSGIVTHMEEVWDGFGSGEAFNYAYLDELYNETYLKEAHMNAILSIFAIQTIFVACLGLFGLVTFTAQQRFKEIGIRKVLGSSASNIVTLLAKDFLKLVGISMLIAFPVGYYLMDRWLQDFAYRIDMDWWVFALAALITVLIAFVTLGFRSFKAALANPVESLRTE